MIQFCGIRYGISWLQKIRYYGNSNQINVCIMLYIIVVCTNHDNVKIDVMRHALLIET